MLLWLFNPSKNTSSCVFGFQQVACGYLVWTGSLCMWMRFKPLKANLGGKKGQRLLFQENGNEQPNILAHIVGFDVGNEHLI